MYFRKTERIVRRIVLLSLLQAILAFPTNSLRAESNSIWLEVGGSSASGSGISSTSVNSPTLAIAPSGEAYAAWRRNINGITGIYVKRFNKTDWLEVGNGSASGIGISGISTNPSPPKLAIAPDNTPYVAWQDSTGGNWEIHVKRYKGNTWEEVGSISGTSGDSESPALAIAPDNTPYVAWGDSTNGNREIHVKRFNGSGWTEVGTGISYSSGGIILYISLAIAPDSTPYVAWHDSSGGNLEIYVKRFKGSAWEEVGGNSASGSGISGTSGNSEFPTLTIAPNNLPFVAWHEYVAGNWEIYAMRFNGIVWEEVGVGSASGGGISKTTGSSGYPTLAVTSKSKPYVAWEEHIDGISWEIYVKYFNGNTWEEAGVSSATGGGISGLGSGYSESSTLAVAPDGTPYVAWSGDKSKHERTEIYAKRFNEKTSLWVEVGNGSDYGSGISNTSTGVWALSPTLAVASDGTTYSAWQDTSIGTSVVYVKRYKGNSWEEVGSNSASGRGVSDPSDKAYYPIIAIAPDNTPYVAWDDNTNGDWEIRVKRFVGNSWKQVGNTISNSKNFSGPPKLAIAPDGTPFIAWHEAVVNTNTSKFHWEIQVKRFNGSSWEQLGSGVSNQSENSLSPTLAIAPDDTPYTPKGTPCVAWEASGNGNSSIYVKCFKGGTWKEVGSGSVSDSNTNAHDAVFAFAPDNTPYVAWEDNSNGNWEIHVKRFNGSNWEQIGSGSASGSGISSTGGDSVSPTLAIGPDNTPYVAWEDNLNGTSSIYVKRLNGNSWEEIRNGPTSGTGINHPNTNPNSVIPTFITPDHIPMIQLESIILQWEGINYISIDSTVPKLAIAQDRTCFVAWQAEYVANSIMGKTEYGTEIYVKKAPITH